jgi:hypothetical protein
MLYFLYFPYLYGGKVFCGGGGGGEGVKRGWVYRMEV